VLSIIIPSYKGAKILEEELPRLTKYLASLKINSEVIVVDDGSNDDGETLTIVENNNCKYFANKINLGKGAAVRNGVKNAIGNYIIYTDVDIPFEYKAIETAVHYLNFKEFDMVIGDRTLPESKYFSKIPFLRRVGSNVFTFIIGRFVTTGMFDTQCGFKGFKKHVASDLFSHSVINGFSFDVELIYISLKRNYDIKRIPVQLRNMEVSSVRMLKHGLIMLKELVHIKINHLQGKYN